MLKYAVRGPGSKNCPPPLFHVPQVFVATISPFTPTFQKYV